jgi:hypothetical protein
MILATTIRKISLSYSTTIRSQYYTTLEVIFSFMPEETMFFEEIDPWCVAGTPILAVVVN